MEQCYLLKGGRTYALSNWPIPASPFFKFYLIWFLSLIWTLLAGLRIMLEDLVVFIKDITEAVYLAWYFFTRAIDVCGKQKMTPKLSSKIFVHF